MNFALIMFLLLVLTGGIWLLDLLLVRKGRAKRKTEVIVRELETKGEREGEADATG